MAMFDWNQNGKNDIADNFIEYQIYKDVTGQKDDSSYTPRSGGGISTFGAIISSLSGLVGQAFIYTLLDIDVENVPVIVMIILWIVISAVVGAVADSMGL